MEVLALLDELEDILDKGSGLPFTSKAMYDKEELLDIVKEIKLKLPDEVKQAKWVKEERQRILLDAQKEAADIVKEAENRIISMIDEHEITRKAVEQKDTIIESANSMAREISQGTKEYADEILAGIEEMLITNLDIVQNNRRELK
ncbi:MAG: ATPase [Bacilli bacterium]|nr:ATPase [Clostridia bacterium]